MTLWTPWWVFKISKKTSQVLRCDPRLPLILQQSIQELSMEDAKQSGGKAKGGRLHLTLLFVSIIPNQTLMLETLSANQKSEQQQFNSPFIWKTTGINMASSALSSHFMGYFLLITLTASCVNSSVTKGNRLWGGKRKHFARIPRSSYLQFSLCWLKSTKNQPGGNKRKEIFPFRENHFCHLLWTSVTLDSYCNRCHCYYDAT